MDALVVASIALNVPDRPATDALMAQAMSAVLRPPAFGEKPLLVMNTTRFFAGGAGTVTRTV